MSELWKHCFKELAAKGKPVKLKDVDKLVQEKIKKMIKVVEKS